MAHITVQTTTPRVPTKPLCTYCLPLQPHFERHLTIEPFDRHHLWLLTLKDRLFLAPIENPQAILDVGTGTGLWAMCVPFSPSEGNPKMAGLLTKC